ncbi:MAG: hypothetical protein M1837_002033 [Sclerophora amabilis]|nr:MAG: hypothetical protein M1837_002033 [Sclerophora amabilis]
MEKGKGDPEHDDGEEGGGFISDESSFYGDETQREQLESQSAAFNGAAWLATYQTTIPAIAAEARRTAPKAPAPEVKPATLYNPYVGQRSGRQLSEDIPSFLERLHPRTTLASDIGPWIWIANPYSSKRPLNKGLAGLKEAGEKLLSEWMERKSAIEQDMAASPKSALNGALTKERKLVEREILNAARANNITTGKVYASLVLIKHQCQHMTGHSSQRSASADLYMVTSQWMLFPTASSIYSVWSPIAHATASNQLGVAAKVATATEEGSDRVGRLICIYTVDFADRDDVKRVLEKLVELGLVSKREKSIYYKCDAYTHLGISSGNEWGIQASMYASKDFLDKQQRKIVDWRR